MHIFMPLAGQGRRFQDAGYALPKLLLPLHGKRMVQWAIEGLQPLASHVHYYVSTLFSQHPLREGLLPPGCWHVISQITLGPLQTLLSQQACLQTAEEILIVDGDSYMDARDLEDILRRFREEHAEAGTPIRATKEAHCAFVQLNENGWVLHTREKDAFTNWSATGPYWFQSGHLFLQAAQRASRNGAISIAPVFNELQRVKGILTGSFIHFGTPKDYEAYQTLPWILA